MSRRSDEERPNTCERCGVPIDDEEAVCARCDAHIHVGSCGDDDAKRDTIPTVPEPMTVEHAWAEADRVTAIAEDAAAVAVRADRDWRAKDLAASQAWATAEAIGPRPAKVAP